MILTVYWIYRGTKAGVYAALNVLFVFFFALMFCLNYYEEIIPLVRKVAPKSSYDVRHSVALIFTYCVSLGIFLYFCLWLCIDRVPVQRTLDAVGGATLGLITGIYCCAGLLFMWFSLPFAETVLPVDDSTMFFPCHKLAFSGVTFVGDRFPSRGLDGKAERLFHGERFLRDLRYGQTDIRDYGDGFYVSSVPTGLSVFFSGSAARPVDFYIELKKRMAIPESEIRPSQKREPFGRKGRTPLFIPYSGDKCMVAVMMDGLPQELKEETSEPLDRFLPDGEVGVGETKISDYPLFLKVYSVEKKKNVGTLIALFNPKPKGLHHMVGDFLPTRACFPLKKTKQASLKTELMKNGATPDEADHIIDQVQMCGKAVFTGLGNHVYAVEMISPSQWKLFKAAEPVDLDKEEASRPGRRRVTTPH